MFIYLRNSDRNTKLKPKAQTKARLTKTLKNNNRIFVSRLASEWRQSATTTTTDTTTSTKTPLNTSQLQQAALTKMLVLVSCVFIVCSSPGLALALWRRIDTQFGPGGKYSNMFYASHIIAYHGFTACNSSVNFFVYFRRSSRFRAELRVLFGCCRKLEEKGAGDAISRSSGTLVTQS